MDNRAFLCGARYFIERSLQSFCLSPNRPAHLALTVVYGLTNGWGALGVVVATRENLFVLQANYVLAGLALKRLGKPVEGHVLRLRIHCRRPLS